MDLIYTIIIFGHTFRVRCRYEQRGHIDNL